MLDEMLEEMDEAADEAGQPPPSIPMNFNPGTGAISQPQRARRGASKRQYEEEHDSDSGDGGTRGRKRRKYTFKGKLCSACGSTNGTRARRCVNCDTQFPATAPKPKPSRRPPVFEPQIDDDDTHVVEFVTSKCIIEGFDVGADGKFAKQYACRTLGGSRLNLTWLSAEEALRLGKRSRAAFLRFANKISEDETDAEVVERILDCRVAQELPPRFLNPGAVDPHFAEHELLPLPDCAHFGPLHTLGSAWCLEGYPLLGDWFTEYHTLLDEEEQESAGPSPCRGRVVSARTRNSDETDFDYEIIFSTGELADSRRVVSKEYLAQRPTRRLSREVPPVSWNSDASQYGAGSRGDRRLPSAGVLLQVFAKTWMQTRF
jgi:hypothetical protein